MIKQSSGSPQDVGLGPLNIETCLVSIVLATYNEVESIVPLIDNLFKHVRVPLEIVIVDDLSTDGTSEAILALQRPEIILVRRPRARGLASAMLRGFIETRGDILAWMDADAWMIPPLLPSMIAKLAENDIVVASRFVPGGGDERDASRVWASRAVNLFARLVLGTQIHDYTSNFAVMRRSVFNNVIPVPLGFGEYFIDLIHNARVTGCRILEVPYLLSNRQAGDSKAFPNLLRFFKLGMQYFIRICLLRLRGM